MGVCLLISTVIVTTDVQRLQIGGNGMCGDRTTVWRGQLVRNDTGHEAITNIGLNLVKRRVD
jgi:hypothetical protein